MKYSYSQKNKGNQTSYFSYDRMGPEESVIPPDMLVRQQKSGKAWL
jgi:hypothetical protein